MAWVLRPIIRREVHPETTYNHQAQFDKGVGFWCKTPGSDIGQRQLERPGYKEKYGKPPLPPRDRLSARLTILLALTKVRHALMKEILADTDSIADAKAHGYELKLGGNDD